jgi:hypothetical protein
MSSSRTTLTHVEPLAGHWLRLDCGDGAVHEVDLGGLLHASGVFASIRDDRGAFEAVSADREFGAIIWPGDIDLDPARRPGAGIRTPDAATRRPARLTPACTSGSPPSPATERPIAARHGVANQQHLLRP